MRRRWRRKGHGGEQADTNASGKDKKKPRPRLTVRPDVMERLKNIAAYRDMSASDLADELLANYLNAIPEEELRDLEENQDGTEDNRPVSDEAVQGTADSCAE